MYSKGIVIIQATLNPMRKMKDESLTGILWNPIILPWEPERIQLHIASQRC